MTVDRRARGAQAGRADGRRSFLDRSPRLLVAVYFGGAVALAPWIVLLYLQQPVEALAHHLHLVSFGVSVLMLAGMLTTAHWCAGRSPKTVLGATCTATLVFITAWFSVLGSVGGRSHAAVVLAVVVQLPVTGVCLWLVWRLFHPTPGRPEVPDHVASFLAVGAVVLLPLVVVVSTGVPAVHAAGHLRAVWTGLDVFELLGMAATGWCLHRGRPGVAVAAAVTGTLLFCDAWFNVVGTTGAVQLAGIAMAVVELPLSALSLAVARRETARWAGPTAPEVRAAP